MFAGEDMMKGTLQFSLEA